MVTAYMEADDKYLSQKLGKPSNPGAFQLAIYLIAVLRSSRAVTMLFLIKHFALLKLKFVTFIKLLHMVTMV